MNKKNLNNVDFIRSVAVLFVFLSHLISKYPTSGSYHVQTLGILGVVIFFTLTTFVLMISLKKRNYNKIYVINYKFYIERIFRIYPLSILIVIIYSIIKFNLEESFNITLFLSNIFLIQVLNQSESFPELLWSLSYEVLAYLFLPFILFIFKNKNAKRNILYFWILLIFFTLISKYFNQNLFLIIKYMPCFVSGVIAFIFFKKKNINYYYLITYLFLGFLFIPIFTGVFNVPQNLSCILFTFPLGFLIAYSKEIKSNAINIVCNKIAKYSYGIYLFQRLAIDIIFNYSNLLLPIIFKITLAILLTILFAYAVYKFIEKPFIQLGKYLSSKCNNY
jgi:peptidoglycan/LPS O-acetylase OafA/YrhL